MSQYLIDNLTQDINQAVENQQTPDELLVRLVDNIGHPNGKFRDDVIFNGWYDLLGANALTTEQKLWLIDQVFKRQLLAMSDQVDSVFERSFTSLFLVALINDHLQNAWLSTEQIEQLKSAIFAYGLAETDKQGEVVNKGWAHSFAHLGDLLVVLAWLPDWRAVDTMQVFAILQRSLFDLGEFWYKEPDRLSNVLVILATQGKLSDNSLLDWLKDGQRRYDNQSEYNQNWAEFINTLYWKLKFENHLSEALASQLITNIENNYRQTLTVL